MTKLPCLAALAVLLLASACAVPRPVADTACVSGSVLIDAHFDGGQLGKCMPSNDGSFALTLFPEDAPPINTSPWYAYRVSGRAGDKVVIRMSFEDGYARYWPKTSLDGVTWNPLPEANVRVDENKEWMTLNLTLEQGQTWVAGQELLTQAYYDKWLDELESHDEFTTRLLGRSNLDRPLYLAENDDRPEFVLMIGRQHPPEVTGAIAMRSFIRTVLADTELARQFRARYQLGIVPLMNPDGVARGHWRHNVDGTDVNRDWGPFKQPETQAVMHWVEAAEASGKTLRLLLDFHSTFEDLFYTQPMTENPVDFASLWLGAAAERLPDFPFKHDARPPSEQANSKNYFFKSRGIPSVTYESGDETDRGELEAAAVVFAEEMMRVMLATER